MWSVDSRKGGKQRPNNAQSHIVELCTTMLTYGTQRARFESQNKRGHSELHEIEPEFLQLCAKQRKYLAA